MNQYDDWGNALHGSAVRMAIDDARKGKAVLVLAMHAQHKRRIEELLLRGGAQVGYGYGYGPGLIKVAAFYEVEDGRMRGIRFHRIIEDEMVAEARRRAWEDGWRNDLEAMKIWEGAR